MSSPKLSVDLNCKIPYFIFIYLLLIFFIVSHAEKRQPSEVVVNRHKIFYIFKKLLSFSFDLSKYIMRPKTEMQWSFSSNGRLGNICERETLIEWQLPSVINYLQC